jgi:predicted RNase H-like nuclease
LYGDDAPVHADDDAQDPLLCSLYEMYRVHLAFDHFGILNDAATHWIAA